MSTQHAEPKTQEDSTAGKPIEVFKLGSVLIPIYRHTNIVPQRDEQGKIVYAPPDSAGKRKALIKYQSDSYTLAYYLGSKRIRKKCNTLQKARAAANAAAVLIANGETEVLKLTGPARGDYVHAMQKLRKWKPDAELNLAIADYVAAVSRLPENTSLKECVDFFVKRHPIGLPQKTVREIVDELVESKEKSGKSEVYVRKMRQLLGHFADAFDRRFALVTGKQIEDYIRGLGVGGRTQNNNRQLINTLFKFAIKRGYLPKDHDEMSGVEKVTDGGGEIEVFTPAELRKLFAACETPTIERGKPRTRQDMIPYLAIAAFCGLRAAEIQRLDWSQVNLTGSEKFIEVKASIAKTGSRRTVPIPENCVAWLLPYVKQSGPVTLYERADMQLFIHLAGKSGVPWKHNGLRHSYISYRVAETKNVHQTSLEAGNSPQMIFKHYRQLVTEAAAKEWFSIAPAKKDGAEIIPMPVASVKAETADSAIIESAPAVASPANA